jgi:hypothetical protein
MVVPARPVERISASEDAAADTWQRFEAATEAHSEDLDEPEREAPLATWVRVAIVVVALLAFFAVSLIATKQV